MCAHADMKNKKKIISYERILRLTERLRKKTLVGYSYSDDSVDEKLYMIAYKELSNSDIVIVKALFPFVKDIGYSLGIKQYDKKYVYIQKSIMTTCEGAFGEHTRISLETHIFYSARHCALMNVIGMYDKQKVAL